MRKNAVVFRVVVFALVVTSAVAMLGAAKVLTIKETCLKPLWYAVAMESAAAGMVLVATRNSTGTPPPEKTAEPGPSATASHERQGARRRRPRRRWVMVPRL